MTNAKKYKLRTIEDIYRQVPPDRWQTCLAELATAFHQAKVAEEKMRAEIPRWIRWLFGIRFKSLIWVDDGLGEIRTRAENQWTGTVRNSETLHSEDG